MMTKREVNESICGICGIIGEIYFGDGNEKICCNVSEVCMIITIKKTHA